MLLEGLRLGVEVEKAVMLDALMSRKTTRGLSGVISYYENLPPRLQGHVLRHIKIFHHALRESGRSDRPELRLASMRLIALGREGKLAYVISENLHDSQEELSKAAVEAIVSLAKWVSDTSRRFAGPLSAVRRRTRGRGFAGGGFATRFREIMEQRPEIETAVARALDVHRGKQTQEFLRARCFWPIRPGAKRWPFCRRRNMAGRARWCVAFSSRPAETCRRFSPRGDARTTAAPFRDSLLAHHRAAVLDAILRKTHWLKDHQLQLCMHQVTRGAWWQEVDLIAGRPEPTGPGRRRSIGEWLAVSGTHDLMQDERMNAAGGTLQGTITRARLRLLRIAVAAQARIERAIPARDAERRRRAADAAGGAGNRAAPASGCRQHAASTDDQRAGNACGG